MKFVLIGLLLIGCTSTKTKFQEDHLTLEVAKLKQTNIRLSYLIEDNMCHIQYGVCLGEDKKTDAQCSATKEQCIINVYELWKKLLE